MAAAPSRARTRRAPAPDFFESALAGYRDLTLRALAELIPASGPPHLYDLVADYPARAGKGLRAALCLATCAALGGRLERALNSAVAIELFHNAFLIHDDIQDGSTHRRGGSTLHRAWGEPIALNVGNATTLLGLQRVMANRALLGAEIGWAIAEETERMMRHSLEGQAIELGWIRDNVHDLAPRDYLYMCLKKTSWYSFIHPMRVGALIAEGPRLDPARFCRAGWYFGAAFQIQDDLLNLTGDYQRYGKEILGDLVEGKRTLMLVHLLGACGRKDRSALERLLALPRDARAGEDLAWVHRLMLRHGSLAFARRAARQLAGAALLEMLSLFGAAPDSHAKRFIVEMTLYVVDRER